MSLLKKEILRKVDQLFYAQGVLGTGIDEISVWCDVSKASIYRLFTSKENLVVEWLKYRHIEYMEKLRSSVELLARTESEKPLAVFDSLALRFKEEGFRGCAFSNTIIELGHTNHPAVDVAKEHKKSLILLFQTYLEDAGYVEAQEIASLFVQLLDGAQITALYESGSASLIRAREVASQTLATLTS